MCAGSDPKALLPLAGRLVCLWCPEHNARIVKPASVLGWLPGLLLIAPASAQTKAPPDTIYLGAIVTMEPKTPRAEAVATSGDAITAVGLRADVMRLRGPETRVIELGERALLPGFIDAHGHLTATAAFSQYANLSSPPAGPVKSMRALRDVLRRHIAGHAILAGEWVIGYGYDDSLLAERRHPTRADLDAVSTEHPIFVVHVSGHFSAANSRLLTLAKIDASSPNPPGGVIRRQKGSQEPDGVLEETAHMALYAKVPKPGLAESLSLIAKALNTYASMGITTVQDGGAMPENLALLSEAARTKLLTLDVVAYRLLLPPSGRFPEDLGFGTYRDRLKIGGVKLILDGSPQGKTAFLKDPYHVPPSGQAAGYRGYAAMSQEVLNQAVLEAVKRSVPLLAHANGDAASQMLIDAVEAAGRDTGQATSQIVMIHAQTVRDDQLDRMGALGMIPSFFVGHTFYWGDWHREETLGSPRAERISPARSAIERGLAFTLHNDAPVVPPEIVRTLWSATTRRTRSGDILGPQQRLTIMEALQGVTINAARQYSEEDRKGSIKAGKLADLVIVSQNPLSMDPERLLDLRIVETISHGLSVYRAPRP